MSTITVTNIKATGETASRAATGVAAAFCKVDQSSTQSFKSSSNVSSLTDGGTGITTVTITNAMSNTNFAMAGSMNTSRYNYSVAVLTSSTFKMNVRNDAATFVDTDEVSGISYGDLA